MENIHQQKKKRVKRKKRKISDAKRSAMAKKKQSVRKKKKQTRSVHKAFRKASTGITINLNLAQPQQPLRKRLKSTRRRVHRREALVQPIVNASQFRNQNTFYKPSVNNTGNSLIEYARGGAVMNVSNGLNFGASGAMAQLQIDKEGSKRINTETGRNVGEEERQIRRIMQQKGNLATLLVVKKWLKSEGYSINSSMKKDDVIEYILSTSKLSQLFLNKDWKKKAEKTIIPVPDRKPLVVDGGEAVAAAVPSLEREKTVDDAKGSAESLNFEE